MTARRTLGALFVVVAAGCRGGAPGPVAIDTAHDACRFCRMVISDPSTAAELVAPFEEPVLFDDLGCLKGYLESGPSIPSGTRTFVTDHRTGEFVAAERAVYARHDVATTPMGSRVFAHRDEASRASDAGLAGARPVPIEEVFGGRLPPGASR